MKLVIFAVDDIEYSAGRWMWPQKVTCALVATRLRAASGVFWT
jgi:hypothetical protein